MNRIVKNVAARIGLREVSQLEADISTYTSEADLHELHEIMNRYTPEETAEIRRAVHGSILV